MKTPPRRVASRALFALFPLVLLSALGACSPDASATTSSSAESPSKATVEREVLDLIQAVTPASPTLPPAEKNAWFGRRRETLERMRAGGPEIGLEALRMYGERDDDLPEIRAGLLDVAAHAAPEETRPVLIELLKEYGDELFVRTQAALFLGDTSPETAIEEIEPILANETRGTYPPDERLLEAWNQAAIATDYDRMPLLCDIATDQNREQSCRHQAVRLLGELPGEQSRQALELVLVESSGNQYIRRIAAQSLQSTLASEDLCELLRGVVDREADTNFQIFLDNMIQQSCR